jgi:lipopolysaccharide/colanic/teichoic acid biosynthesis glycosyltransferase
MEAEQNGSKSWREAKSKGIHRNTVGIGSGILFCTLKDSIGIALCSMRSPCGGSLVNVGLVDWQALEKAQTQPSSQRHHEDSDILLLLSPRARATLHLVRKGAPKELSSWSLSPTKRIFDCACVLVVLPLLIPILLAIAFAVRATSAGPVFFLQKRLGRRGCSFTILKFRTMVHDPDAAYHAVTTAENQPFTSIGPFLRRWKLDELPQIFNVLLGHMSLVGPRPKMPEHVIGDLACRPGITGAATMAFASEETVLDRVPQHHLESYYRTVVLPAKHHLDAEYMARATFFSDLKLIVNSILRRWDGGVADSLIEHEKLEHEKLEREKRESEAKAREAKASLIEPVPVCAVVTEPVSVRTGTR